MSIVFQDLKLFEDRTAMQNLLIKNELTQYYDQQTIESFAATLHVSHTLNRPIQTLSYGERQRIAIIRAMLQPFEVLILDEPFSHLDKDNTHRCVQLIEQEVKLRNATIIHCDLEPDLLFSNAQILSL
ncbi:MAG: ABC transporter [Bacteroidetes bacterium OLB11]|nr:MAG: ABC transporter [Bacteroidetes bacterium OLB11]